jgi:uncharacterized protein DUF1236
MNLHVRIAVAAALLLCSSGLASAEMGAPLQISDDVVLSGAQEHLIWNLVGDQSSPDERAAIRFDPSIYGAVPASVSLHAFPLRVTRRIPVLERYQYATFENVLLIVNPTDRKIVDIITP